MTPGRGASTDIARVRETPLPGPLPIYRHEHWRAFPWLVHGITARGQAFDLGLFASAPAGLVLGRYRNLAAASGFAAIALAPQEHGRTIIQHSVCAPGVLITAPADGHVASPAGPLLAVTVADCVPVYAVDAGAQRVALLHAGWRGIAAGVLEAGLSALGARVDDIWLHFGPAICGDCYEVGPEVHEALGLPPPALHLPIDLRAILAQRATTAGVAPSRISTSVWCTRCAGSPFFSHRAGRPERQAALLGIRSA
jgi:hypothetical protein